VEERTKVSSRWPDDWKPERKRKRRQGRKHSSDPIGRDVRRGYFDLRAKMENQSYKLFQK
jgi:hypothetical protein